jgi:Tfp pilus assembly protein PilE
VVKEGAFIGARFWPFVFIKLVLFFHQYERKFFVAKIPDAEFETNFYHWCSFNPSGEFMAKQSTATQTPQQQQQQLNHHGNQLNTNKGTPGNNRVNSQATGNRGKQLNPNRH